MAETDGVEEIEQAGEIVERVAAIDIAKASGMVCVRTPHEDKPGLREDHGPASQLCDATDALEEALVNALRLGGLRVERDSDTRDWKVVAVVGPSPLG
jgi:hypothetical protein